MRTAYLIIGGLLILAVALITFVPAVGHVFMPLPQARVSEDGIQWPVKKSVRFYIPSEGMGTNELPPSSDGPDAKTRCGTDSVCAPSF
jgi:hypothetical protein